MNILIIGSGGREHAFAWKIAQSPKCSQLYVAPGNAGTQEIARNLSLDPLNFQEIGDFVTQNNINLVIVGPEEPLARGIRDHFKNQQDLRDIPIVGPDKRGAQLEASKDFAKQFMIRHGIPTAAYKTFDRQQLSAALDYIKAQPLPIVLKADGLAAGKGVVICSSHQEAADTLTDMLAHSKFGAASERVVVEEFLSGIELSTFVLTDGHSYKILPSAKDYKRIGEGDTGLNTGGMGAVSPVPFADEEFLNKVEELIVKPTIKGLKSEGIDYKGFIFLGLINVNNEPKVIEYNVRMGDPETQVVLPRISSDLVELLLAAAQGNLEQYNLSLDPRTATTVVMVSGGYPGNYQKGLPIKGLDSNLPGMVFHAGTKAEADRVVTHGGRVLAVTSFGHNIREALNGSYKRIAEIDWPNANYRKDIGQDLLKNETITHNPHCS